MAVFCAISKCPQMADLRLSQIDPLLSLEPGSQYLRQSQLTTYAVAGGLESVKCGVKFLLNPPARGSDSSTLWKPPTVPRRLVDRQAVPDLERYTHQCSDTRPGYPSLQACSAPSPS